MWTPAERWFAYRPGRRGFENEDVAAAVLRLEHGAIGTITMPDSIVSRWRWEHTAREHPVYTATNHSACMIGDSEGALSIPDQSLWRHDDPPDWWRRMTATSSPMAVSDPRVTQIRNFADVIAGRDAPRVSGEEALKSRRVVDAIQTAASTAERVLLHG